MPSTDKDRVRLLTSDVGGDSNTDFIFTDDEVNTFIALEPNLYRAAALALRTMAANEALVHKRIRFLELSTDGPAVAKELRATATELEGRANESETYDVDPDFANFGDSPFTRRNLRLGIEEVDS
jgi:hypothetical protein